MKYILIEDEQLAAKRMRDLIQEIRPAYEFVAKFDSVESAVISLPVLQYDLLFMDIQLADGISFEIFDQIKVERPIIFTTAYDEFAIQAFKTNSVDYLLKPIGEHDLDQAISKFESNFSQQQVAPAVEPAMNLQDLMKSLQPTGKERFVVKVGDHLKTVNTSDVQLIYSQDKGTYLFTDDGKRFLIDYALDTVEDLLATDTFFRISRKFILNLNYIQDIIAFTNSRLEVKVNQFTDEQIIVSRERVSSFKSWLDR